MNLKVRVHQNSRQEKIELDECGNYEVWLKEKAIGGRANQELVRILARHLNTDWRRINIKNPKSRIKLVEIV